MKDIKFSVFFKETELIITVICKNDNVTVEHFSSRNVFLPDINTPADILSFFKGRVFPDNESFTKDELKKIGLEKYDVVEIIMITKGKRVNDKLSIEIES